MQAVLDGDPVQTVSSCATYNGLGPSHLLQLPGKQHVLALEQLGYKVYLPLINVKGIGADTFLQKLDCGVGQLQG